MDWIFDNLQIVIAVAGVIAYWLNARNKDKAGEQADYDGDGRPDNVPGGGRQMREHEQALEQAENTRRIQEEIRRKIAERNAGADESPRRTAMPPPMPTGTPPPMPHVRDRRHEQAVEARRAEAEHETALVMERQRALADQLAALNARKVEAARDAKAAWSTSSPKAKRNADDDLSVAAQLRDAPSLRRAMVLREVLSTPVGMR
jgi:hypothetical protein